MQVPVTVRGEIESLRGMFGSVFLEVFYILRTCPLKKIKEYLSAAFEETRNEMKTIKSANELKDFLLNKSSFSDYNILEQLVSCLELTNAQKKLSEFATFRDEKYEKILAEYFPFKDADVYVKDYETQVCCERVFKSCNLIVFFHTDCVCC